MATDVKQYTILDVVNGIKKTQDAKIKITVPKLQRNLVWSKDQKLKFIDSIKKGFPFGSLLLFQKNGENFLLIDGLQRSSTILDHAEKPTAYFTAGDVDKKYIDVLIKMVDELKQDSADSLRNLIGDWVSHVDPTFDEANGYSAHKLVRYLVDNLDITVDSSTKDILVDEFTGLTSKIRKDSNIANVQVPIVIYTGPEKNLPEIFERINTKGTKLSKYQVFAATWDQNIRIKNIEIIDKIKEKYEALINEGFEIEDYSAADLYKEETKFTLYEYLFGFGKLISDKYPHLFGKSSKADTTESIGFNLFTVCLGLPLSDMADLPIKLSDNILEQYEKALFEVIEFIDQSLSVLSFKANRKNKKDKGDAMYHSELLIVSLISAVFHIKFDTELEQRRSWRTNKNKLKQNIKYHYLYDIIRDVWRGTGDAKIKENVIDIVKIEKNSPYLSSIPYSKWENVLQEWFENQLLRNESERVTIQNTDILFLKYLYNPLLSNEENYEETYEIDHLFTVEQSKKLAAVIEEGLPISCVANLSMIPSNLNRSKGKYTIFEYYKNKVSAGELTNEQANVEMDRLEEKLVFSPVRDIHFDKKEKSKDWYMDKLTNRFEFLKMVFKNKVLKED
jgi:Protein of unknown function DUF262